MLLNCGRIWRTLLSPLIRRSWRRMALAISNSITLTYLITKKKSSYRMPNEDPWLRERHSLRIWWSKEKFNKRSLGCQSAVDIDEKRALHFPATRWWQACQIFPRWAEGSKVQTNVSEKRSISSISVHKAVSNVHWKSPVQFKFASQTVRIHTLIY